MFSEIAISKSYTADYWYVTPSEGLLHIFFNTADQSKSDFRVEYFAVTWFACDSDKDKGEEYSWMDDLDVFV